VQVVHSRRDQYSCVLCKRAYTRKDKVVEHLRRKHGGDGLSFTKGWKLKPLLSTPALSSSITVFPGDTHTRGLTSVAGDENSSPGKVFDGGAE